MFARAAHWLDEHSDLDETKRISELHDFVIEQLDSYIGITNLTINVEADPEFQLFRSTDNDRVAINRWLGGN